MKLHDLKTRFIADATRGTAMCMASAAVLATMAFDMAGGVPKPYELREFRAGVSALMNGRMSTPTFDPVIYPERGARVQVASAQPVRVEARLQRASLTVAETPEAEALEMLGGAEGEVVEVEQTIEAPEELSDEELYEQEVAEIALEEGFPAVDDAAL